MTFVYRIPTWSTEVTVNGRHYDARDGLFWPASAADEAEFLRHGGLPNGTVFPAWDDLSTPVSTINLSGTSNPPAVDNVASAVPSALLFSGSVENSICGIVQTRHGTLRDAPIRPHIHWFMPTGSADAVTWQFYYRHLGHAGETFDAWSSAVNGVVVAGDPSVTNQHCITSFGAIDMSGRHESACIAWRLHRMGNTDAASGAAALIQLDFHYQIGKTGTIPEIPD